MATRRVKASFCRACNKPGLTNYCTVLDRRVALCPECTGDYLRVEKICQSRGTKRERAENAAIAARNGVRS